jgi:hypothetical protein
VIDRMSNGISLIDRGRLKGYQPLRLPHLLDNEVTVGGELGSLANRPLFTLQKDS